MFIYNNEIHLEKHISYELNKGNYILHINNDSVIAHKVYDISTHKFITYNDNYFVTKHYEGNNHIDWTIFSRKDTSTITFMNGIAIDFKRSVIAVMGTELNNSTIIIKNIYTQNTLSTIQLIEFENKNPFLLYYIDTAFISDEFLSIIWNDNVDLGGLDEIDNISKGDTSIFAF